ncbi:MAG: FtsX-like permease family protein [Prevotellaceae bacterium]|nr:FtsX-like permease family protein [Prevotellaceae bacterium]
MIIHNLIIGWRNILKYKTQNIISVLCLSFGVLCFAVTLYFADVIWQNVGKNVMTSNYVTLESRPIKSGENYLEPIFSEEITKIKQLPMVKHVGYMDDSYYGYYESSSIYNRKDKFEFHRGLRVSFVSPEWFIQKDFYSVTTNKKIETLKPGTVVINRKVLQHMIEDNKYARNYYIKHLDKEYTVNDIVYSPTIMDYYDAFIVIDKSNYDSFTTHELDITLKDGYTFKELKEELTKVLPGHKWTKRDGDPNGSAFLVFFLLISIGISVLVIGLSGYLKMQLQLFLLRRREMAICRCNGARPIQLFYMLLAEIFIVFTFVAAISLAISYAFEAYSMPLIHDTHMLDYLDFEPSIIYRTEIKIVLFTFLASVAVAWFVVRRSLKTPLVNTVGRSFTQRTRWNGTMQVVQYSTAIIFFFVCTMILGALEYVKIFEFDVPGGPGYYKDILVFDYLPSDKVKALPSVESHACIIDLSCEIRTEVDTTSTAIPRGQRFLKDDIQVNEYCFTATNSEAFRLFKMDIYKDTTEAYKTIKCPIPVFVKPEHLKETMSILGLSYQVSPQEYVLPDHKRYVVLGFTDNLPNSKIRSRPKNFIVIDNNEGFIDEEIDSVSVLYREPFVAVKPRNNDWDAAIKAMDELQHKMSPSLGADIHYGATIAYDTWFRDLKILNYIMGLTSILTLVSLVCIVMTVFSSISLETRGRQKDVAIRKVNGAKIRDIVMLFGRYYIVTISISSLIALLIVVVLIICISIIGREWPDAEMTLYLCLSFLSSIAVITGVTVATVWQKIYRISHTNPSEIVSKD